MKERGGGEGARERGDGEGVKERGGGERAREVVANNCICLYSYQ